MKKKNKFKVGDLVMLSAAGKNVEQNHHLYEGWGIVVRIGHPTGSYPIRTEWYGGDFGTEDSRPASFKQYELKFYKKRT